MKSNISKIMIVLVIAVLVAVFFGFDLGQYLSFDYLKSRQSALASFYADHQLMTMMGYMVVYIVVAALSLPGAAVMTLAGGAMFGFWFGLILVSFASTIGATFAFLVARFLLRDTVQRNFGDRLKAINEGIKKDGAFYLFTLRLVPIFPFFVINLVMGLTPVRTGVFYLVSQAGMLPGTAVYVNAGTQLAQIDSLSGILSPGLIFSFALLGIFPLIAKKITAVIQSQKALAKYPKPNKFDYNLVVIGAGAAGLVTSYIAATVRAKVALIEKHKMGGDCLNTGCVPSKALIRSAKILSYVKRAKEVKIENSEKTLVCDHNGRDVTIAFDEILVAVGRAANISGFGLEELGIELTPRKTLSANDFLQTSIPTIYCAGDVVGPYQFTHVAGHQAWYASVNALFGGLKSFRVDYSAIPWVTYTDPEVARVGLNETDAKEKGIAFELTRYDINDLDRAIADSEDYGFVKVLTKPGTDKILGVTIVGAHAGDILAEFVFAVKHGLGLNKIMGTIHAYPTMAEANKYVAGVWKKAHAPEKILDWLGKYHAWMRG